MVGLVQFGVWGGIVLAVLVGIRTLLVVVISLWSLKADRAGRTHALALLRALRFALPAKDRSP
jgi:hypothetical protein